MPGYKSIAVASTFSPRYRAVMAEAVRLAGAFGSSLAVIHATESDEEKEKRFCETLADLGWSGESPVLWAPEGSPSEAILSAAESSGMHLLCAGALEHDGEGQPHIGEVARDLLCKSPCDLFLIPRPQDPPAPITHVVAVVENDASRDAFLKRLMSGAQRLGAERITLLAIRSPFGADGPPEEAIEHELAGADKFDGEIEYRILDSNTGYAVCEFVKESSAELLAAPRRESCHRANLSPQMSWLQQVMPTTLWLIGPPAKNGA